MIILDLSVGVVILAMTVLVAILFRSVIELLGFGPSWVSATLQQLTLTHILLFLKKHYELSRTPSVTVHL